MLSMNIRKASSATIEEAAKLLREGRLVAFPTETVYGLGADATNDKAVAEIFATKGRPQFNPLITHVEGTAMAQRLASWNDIADRLAGIFWPGPLTLVLRRPADSPVSLLVSAGGDTLALRAPAHASARALITAAGIPLAAPSANRSGRVSPTRAEHVHEELGERVSLILDAGACAVGIESTVIDVSGGIPVLLRPGPVTQEQLEEMLRRKVHRRRDADLALKSPGLLASHYAPSLSVRLNVKKVQAKEALLAFGKHVPPGAAMTINVSETGDLKEAAANLFTALRELDRPDYSAIAVMPIPSQGLGIAINDRLERAANGR